MHAVDGTPADCVSLGVHGPARRPRSDRLRVNLGLNYGTGFFWSSGTVGAAFKVLDRRVPCIAFSMAIPADAYGLSR